MTPISTITPTGTAKATRSGVAHTAIAMRPPGRRLAETAQHRQRIARVHERGAAENRIQRVRLERMTLDVGLDEVDVAELGLAGSALGEGEHVARDVQTRDVPGRADRSGGTQARFPVPGADVENRVPFLQLGGVQKRMRDDPARMVGLRGLEPPLPSRCRYGPLSANGCLVLLVRFVVSHVGSLRASLC